MNQSERIEQFTDAIWAWYAANKRELPWRDLLDQDPAERAYKVLVSEVMLQQTQVSRVKVVFRNFLEQFPKMKDLAAASNREVLLAWRGMGYNSRALRLRDAAKKIVGQEYSCPTGINFPQSMDELQLIPGIGHYTAGAIRNFAFNLPTPCIDTNIRRVLYRTFVGPENADGTWRKTDQELLPLVEKVLEVAIFPLPLAPPPRGEGNKNKNISLPPSGEGSGIGEHDTRNWHAALMDFGSLVQTKSNPKWHLCPLTKKGIMKTTPKNFIVEIDPPKRIDLTKREPGRFVGSKFIPNRIFRGKIVEALRDAPEGLTLEKIGREVCIDWDQVYLEDWMKKLITKLVQDSLLCKKGARYALSE